MKLYYVFSVRQSLDKEHVFSWNCALPIIFNVESFFLFYELIIVEDGGSNDSNLYWVLRNIFVDFVYLFFFP